MNKFIFFSLVLFFSVFSVNVNAQTNDAQLWTEIGIKKKLTKDIDVSLTQALRLKQNIIEVDKYYTELETEYSLTKKFQIGVGYRFEKENKIEYYSTRHRFNFDASYKQKINNIRLSLRTRYQFKYYDFYSSKTGSLNESHIRLRLKASYKFNELPLTPSLSSEVYYSTDDLLINKYRFTLGTKYKINKKNIVSLDYRIQKQANIVNPTNLYILLLSYKFDF